MVRLSSKYYVDEVRALAAAGDDDARAVLVGALGDSRAKVARAARYALAERFVVPRGHLLGLYARTKFAHTRVQVLALLARGERCDSMVSLLEAVAAVDEPNARALACGHLEEWLRTWAPLSAESIRRLAWAVWEAEDGLPPELLARLKGYVRELRGLRARRECAKAVTRVGAAKGVRTAKPKAVVRKPRLEFLDGRVVHRRYELAPTWLARCRGMLCV